MTIFTYVGSTGPTITATLREYKSDGTIGPIDLTVPVVNFQMRSQFGSALLVDAAAIVVDDPLDGNVRYDWTLADTTTAIDSSPGPYKAWWHIDYGSGTVTDTPEFDIQFIDHSPRRVTGPCTDWCSTQDVSACFSDVATGACLTSSVRMASEVLYELSGHTYSGWCQSTIRPCGDGCFPGVQILSRGHIVWSGFGWESNGDPCQCGGWLSQVELPGVAQSIVRVVVNGEVIDPTGYRLDPNNMLVRIDGEAWPQCQNLAAADDAEGAFSVTYSHGYEAPEIGRRAAVELAHEFWLVCNGSACSLPTGVVELTRQGITVKRNADLWSSGATGLPAVDSFIAAFGQRPGILVMSPEVTPTSRRTL